MSTYDAIVIGGGPAGSTFARQMAHAGGRPVILDRAHFPRVKLCAGWISPPVLEAAELDLDAYRQDHTLQEFRGFNIWRMGGREVLAGYDRTISYGIVRSEFDEYLLRRSGAEVHEGQEVTTIRREGNDFVIEAKEIEIRRDAMRFLRGGRNRLGRSAAYPWQWPALVSVATR